MGHVAGWGLAPVSEGWVFQGRTGIVASCAPNCLLSLHRASWVFLVCLAILDARAPR